MERVENLTPEQKAIWEEAKKRYPVDCKVRSLQGAYATIVMEVANHDFYTWHVSHQLYMNGTLLCPNIYRDGNWAEILEYPAGYQGNYEIF